MKNLQGDFQVLIHLIIRRQCLHAANTEKSAPMQNKNFRHSGYSGRQKKNIEQMLKLHQIWTGLWAPDSNY